MQEIQSTAVGRGHVRAVFSPRCKGHAAPLDLIRVHLRAVAMRGRVRAAFADYLVTDSDDEALRELERAAKCAKKYVEKAPDGEAGYPFVNRRAYWLDRIESREGICISGRCRGAFALVGRMAPGFCVSDIESIDAPVFIAGGGCVKWGDGMSGGVMAIRARGLM